MLVYDRDRENDSSVIFNSLPYDLSRDATINNKSRSRVDPYRLSSVMRLCQSPYDMYIHMRN